MRRLSCVSLLCVGLVVAACGSSSSHAPRVAIVIDKSIGGVSLKERRSAVERTLGHGVVVKTEDQKPPEPPAHVEVVMYPDGLEVVYVSRTAAQRARGVAIAVLTKSSRYRTKEGVHVGSSLADVRQIPGIKCDGGNDCQHGNTHNKPGTGFAMRGGRVWRIVVTILD